jgi:hypothetical protein
MPKADLLTPIRQVKNLHPQFLNLISHDIYGPARGMLREVYAEFPDPDGNFVEQFQTSGFDARTFELFLFAMFKHLGHHIEREPRRGCNDRFDTGLLAIARKDEIEVTNDGIQPYTHDPPDRSRGPLCSRGPLSGLTTSTPEHAAWQQPGSLIHIWLPPAGTSAVGLAARLVISPSNTH